MVTEIKPKGSSSLVFLPRPSAHYSVDNISHYASVTAVRGFPRKGCPIKSDASLLLPLFVVSFLSYRNASLVALRDYLAAVTSYRRGFSVQRFFFSSLYLYSDRMSLKHYRTWFCPVSPLLRFEMYARNTVSKSYFKNYFLVAEYRRNSSMMHCKNNEYWLKVFSS